MPTSLSVLPSNYEGTGISPADQPVAKSWTATYGVVGMSGFGKAAWMLDGMNTEGVSAHLLYMPGGYCTYQHYKGDGSDLSQVDVIPFILGTCASVAEVKAAMATVSVWGFDPGMGFAPPSHFLVHDVDSSIAIEFHAEGIRIVDNPTGIGTNAPFMDWHLDNVNNYIGLKSDIDDSIQVGGRTFGSYGQGEGLRGLPGDYTGPSRFIRAFTMINLSDQPADGREAEQFALHMLNAFDIPVGLLKEAGPDGKLVDEVTVWDTISNLTGLRFAYRTLTDPNVYVVDLKKTDFTKPARISELSWKGDFHEVTI